MGKKSRSTKTKASDFQKVKLKVGKKRPLVNNATDIAFKSQSIYIPEQLNGVDFDYNAMGKDFVQHKKTILELLGLVGHCNANFRTDALTSLRIRFSNSKQLIQQFLPNIINKVLRTISDEDQQVRRSSTSLLELIFSQLAEQEMLPFFDIILSHLYCAMSHIYDCVQRDSLKIVDLCMEYFPNLLTHSARNSLLQHFIDLISTKQVVRVKGAEKTTGTTRVLSMKLASKDSSLTWRNRILKRLYDLLIITSESCKKSESSNLWDGCTNNRVQVKWDSPKIRVALTSFESWKLSKPSFSLRSNHASAILSLNKPEDSTSPWELITTLFPLLFDCWHEAASDLTKGLPQECIAMMGWVLNIINVLVKRFMNSSDATFDLIAKVRKNYLSDMMQYFFLPFPICDPSGQHRMLKKRKMNDMPKQNTTADIQNINLSICALMTTLTSKDYVGSDADFLARVAEYLSMLVLSAAGSEVLDLHPKALDQCIGTIKQLLTIANDEATEEGLLHPLLLFYQRSAVGSIEKSRMLKFFTEIYSVDEGQTISRNPVVVEWICSLPDLLVEILSEKVCVKMAGNSLATLCFDSKATELVQSALSSMRLACLHQSGNFCAVMMDKKALLLRLLRDNASVVFCSPSQEKKTVCMKCDSMQAHLFEVLVYYSPIACDADMRTLSQVCHQTAVSPESVRYVSEMFLHRYEETKSAEEFLMAIRFFCSVLLGISAQDLSSLEQVDMNQSYTFMDCHHVLEFTCHMKIVEKLSQILPVIDYAPVLLYHFLREKILNRFHTLPITSSYAILKLVELFFNWGKLTDAQYQDLSKIVGKLIGALLMHFHVSTEDSKEKFVSETMLSASLSLLQRNCAMLRHTLTHLTESDRLTPNAFEASCSVVGYLASNAENLHGCRQELELFMLALKNSRPDVFLTSRFESTLLHLSVLTSQ